MLTLGCIRGGIVEERFLPMQLEDAWGKKTTLSIGLAAIEIDHQMDAFRWRMRRFFFWEGRLWLCHLSSSVEGHTINWVLARASIEANVAAGRGESVAREGRIL
jgi:hypothetical protein